MYWLIYFITVHDTRFSVKAVNIPDFNIQKIISYLLYDSIHNYSLTKNDIHIVNDNNLIQHVNF